jgi:two-component system NtrC family sensor kinase
MKAKPRKPQRKPQRSLRTILIVWFLLFSLVPLAFVTFYSVIKFEKAIDNELSRRLLGNAREISSIFADLESNLEQKRDRYIKNPTVISHLTFGDSAGLRPQATAWLKSDFSSSLTFFARDGRMLASVFKDDKGEIRDFIQKVGGSIFLSNQNLQKLKDVNEYAFVEFGQNEKMSLILFSKVYGNGGRHVGYLEQLIDIDAAFLNRLKQRMKLELMMIKPTGQVVVATHPDFYLYRKEFFQDFAKDKSGRLLNLDVRTVPYGFVIYPMTWGKTDFYLALGASKVEAEQVLSNVNYAFLSVVGAVIILLIITILLATNTLIRPIKDLVMAIQNIQNSDRPVEIPIKSDTEIGLLTESINVMSRNVVQARGDLKKKIAELEAANEELRETQTRLVHSSKMVSLGQLVAGVAHELNNPIGFIYSNMGHLKDYANRLIDLAETAETHPESVSLRKTELDIDYIKKDLPKLISSCEDGARRTRDIVMGLRNFSRLEEAQLKEIDIGESIDNTLNLLSGEIKNRIQVVKDYSPLPRITCYASQINQVFMNILSNAVQAIDGNGNIWITTKTLRRDGKDFVQISFQDSGKGMTSAVMEKIFDPFFSTKGVGQGTGLGLSISYGIIQNHGGDIQVKSQVGIGTEFIVIIPVKAEIDSKNPGFFAH